MATALGYDMLVRYYEATEEERTELLPKMDNYKRKKQITQAEYDRAMAGEPPEGYVAPMAAAADEPVA